MKTQTRRLTQLSVTICSYFIIMQKYIFRQHLNCYLNKIMVAKQMFLTS
jgi:hypothetical protein